MRLKFKTTLSLQLALILATAMILVQVFGVFLERSFQETLERDRGLAIARNQAANIIAVLPQVAPKAQAPVVRSLSTTASQFFLLPDLLTGPDPVRLPELEEQTRTWVAKRNIGVSDVYAAHHFYPHADRRQQTRPGEVVDKRSPVFAMGEAPRGRMANFIARPPAWLPVVVTPEGVRQKPKKEPPSDGDFNWREIITLAFQLEATGEWVTIYRFKRPPPNNDGIAKFNLGLLGAFAISVAALLIGRRTMTPFRRLANSAIQLGRGDKADPIPLSGPSDVREVIDAFNRMNGRVTQSIDYQIGLLRSLGHDIKGPLAAANRLLGDVKPDSTRELIEARLGSVRGIVDAIMNFSRAVMRDGEMQRSDLVEIITTLVDEQDEIGADATLDAPESLPVVCRVKATERAIRNLLENAIKYGQRARVRLFREDDTAILWIDDDGPGVPDAMLEEVFAPFRRLADDDGGSGLGLAIARTIAVDQGGSVRLRNRPEGGLRAELRVAVPETPPNGSPA